MKEGTVANTVVKVAASLSLKGVSKASMETDAAKADFAKGVASTLNGVDESDIKNIVVTEIFVERRLKELEPDLAADLDLDREHRRLQTATGVQVDFDVEVDTASATSAGVGDGTPAAIFTAVASDLTAAVSGGSVVSALNTQGSFSNLDPSFTSSNFDASAVAYSTVSVATFIPTAQPTAVPTLQPTALPTLQPTAVPTVQPTAVPTLQPSPVGVGPNTATAYIRLDPTSLFIFRF